MKEENENIFLGDNILIMNKMKDESIDLIYLDPPFNKNRFFKGKKNSAFENAVFKDKWQKDNRSIEYIENIKDINYKLYKYIKDENNIFDLSVKHYLKYMAIRLIEMKRILKKNGSLYYHIDQSVSHYIKIMLDIIFGSENFLNEIVWSYSHGGRGKKSFAKKHDTIFLYSKTKNYIFNYNDILIPFESKMTQWSYTKGKYAGKDMPNGKVPEDVWNIGLNSMSKEHTGYPTQKPIELLKRIILASSNEGYTVLDPFCGSGTTLVVSKMLKRKYIGIDLSEHAITASKERLRFVSI